ncbi:MAG: hypothetical protein IH795_08205, partial [Bacteroidetes bacterium]|nr:hypothetical protein [Bacteroidota bacterium]
MFEAPIVTTGLLGLVGYRQPFDPAFPVLNAANLTTRSGLIANDNAFAKLQYLLDAQDFSGINEAEFNTFLENRQKQSIINVCNAVFSGSSYIDKQILYKNALNKIDTETLPDGFVGFEIKVSGKKNVAFKIKRVLLDFEGSGSIELLLFNTSQKAAIFAKTIAITSDHQAEQLDLIVDNSGDIYKGDYYFGYLSNFAGIGTLKPFKRDYELSDVLSIITYLNVERGFFPEQSTDVLGDLDNWTTIEIVNGLNPDITVYFDYTEL